MDTLMHQILQIHDMPIILDTTSARICSYISWWIMIFNLSILTIHHEKDIYILVKIYFKYIE